MGDWFRKKASEERRIDIKDDEQIASSSHMIGIRISRKKQHTVVQCNAIFCRIMRDIEY